MSLKIGDSFSHESYWDSPSVMNSELATDTNWNPYKTNENSTNENSTNSSFDNMWTDPNSQAAQAYEAAKADGRSEDAELINKIASQPTGKWLGEWSGDVNSTVSQIMDNAGDKTPLFVAYNLPGRDTGGASAGGCKTPEEYQEWIQGIADGIGDKNAVVVLEPDALPQLENLDPEKQKERLAMLRDAVDTLKANPNTKVYIDAGHSAWKSADEMADRMKEAGIDKADGFSLNTSNFNNTEDEMAYGEELSEKLDGKHFIIDTSRNGNGPTADHEWCNPPDRALGVQPTSDTGNPLVDAFVWSKCPGESDGPNNGGPAAGQWFEEYALDLARNAKW